MDCFPLLYSPSLGGSKFVMNPAVLDLNFGLSSSRQLPLANPALPTLKIQRPIRVLLCSNTVVDLSGSWNLDISQRGKNKEDAVNASTTSACSVMMGSHESLQRQSKYGIACRLREFPNRREVEVTSDAITKSSCAGVEQRVRRRWSDTLEVILTWSSDSARWVKRPSGNRLFRGQAPR